MRAFGSNNTVDLWLLSVCFLDVIVIYAISLGQEFSEYTLESVAHRPSGRRELALSSDPRTSA